MKKPVSLLEIQTSVRSLLCLKKASQERRCPIDLSNPCEADEIDRGFTTETPPHILRAIRYIEENLSEAVTLEKLAQEAYLSKYHFCRLFYGHVGLTPMKFTSWMRIKKARDLLRREDLTVSVISVEVGFKDLGTFIRRFKQLTGMTPSAYRNFLRRKNKPAHKLTFLPERMVRIAAASASSFS